MRSVIEELEQGLIVSCQVVDKEAHRQPGNPMWGPTVMAMLAKAAVLGGACGIRVNGPADTKAVRDTVEVPVIGIHKLDIDGYAVRITPTIESAREIVASGADIVALDATDRPHPEGLSGVEIVRLAKRELSVPIMADVSTCKEGVDAAEAGADIVATTLAGYTPNGSHTEGPSLELVRELSDAVSVPVIAEGRISTPQEAAQAIANGAYAVVVGAMIINPQRITEKYVEELKAYGKDRPRER